MAVKMTSIRLDTRLADEAAKIFGVKSRTQAVHIALREIVALKRFKNLMKKNAGKLSFDGTPAKVSTSRSGSQRHFRANAHIAAELINPSTIRVP
jgi:Arc/MetJ family transcription regulator